MIASVLYYFWMLQTDKGTYVKPFFIRISIHVCIACNVHIVEGYKAINLRWSTELLQLMLSARFTDVFATAFRADPLVLYRHASLCLDTCRWSQLPSFSVCQLRLWAAILAKNVIYLFFDNAVNLGIQHICRRRPTLWWIKYFWISILCKTSLSS